MAKIKFRADSKEESVSGGGGGKFAPKVRGIYNLQIVEASDGEVTSQQAKNPGVPITKFRLEVADDDERGQLGAYVYHSVTWLPPGTKGHGMAVHWLHATNMPYDGAFDFDEQDFLAQDHALVRALLEVEEYDKVKDGVTYVNEKFVVREVYTDTHPAPDELPPPRKAKEPAHPGLARTAGKPPTGGPRRSEATQAELEEVPF